MTDFENPYEAEPIATPFEDASREEGDPSGTQWQDEQRLLAAQAERAWCQVDARSVTLGRITGWIMTLVLLSVLGVALGSLAIATWRVGWMGVGVGVGGGVLALVLIWFAQGWPAMRYRYLHYRLGPLGFEIRRGVLWRRQITVPLSRVQHTDVSQGPLERRLGLGRLVVYTAGTQFASVELAGLAFAEAEQLRDALVTSGEVSDGV